MATPALNEDSSLGALADHVPLKGKLGPYRAEQPFAKPHQVLYNPSDCPSRGQPERRRYCRSRQACSPRGPDRGSASRRAEMSVEPPGAAPTKIVIASPGMSCALAGGTAAKAKQHERPLNDGTRGFDRGS